MKFSERVSAIEKSPIRAMSDKANKDSINLGLGMPYCINSQNIKNAAISAVNNNKTFYTSNQGINELRKAIVEEFNKKSPAAAAPENVIINAGVAESIFQTMFSLLDPQDEVLLPNPGFVAYPSVAKTLKCNIKYYNLKFENQFGLSADEVISKISVKTKVIVLNSPGNPTGGIDSKEELIKLADYLNDKEICVLSDEVYSNLNYTNDEIDSISKYLPLDKVFVFSGVSKEFSMTGWRIGWTISSVENITQLLKIHMLLVSSASSISQHAALEAVSSKNRDVVGELSRNRLLMNEGLSRFKTIRYNVPKGGLYYFADFSHYGDDIALANRILDNTNVITIPGSAFGDSGYGYLRLSFGAHPGEIVTGLEKIRMFLEG